jgi:hypothetical protein
MIIARNIRLFRRLNFVSIVEISSLSTFLAVDCYIDDVVLKHNGIVSPNENEKNHKAKMLYGFN